MRTIIWVCDKCEKEVPYNPNDPNVDVEAPPRDWSTILEKNLCKSCSDKILNWLCGGDLP